MITSKSISVLLSNHVYLSGGPGLYYDAHTFFTLNPPPLGCSQIDSCILGDTCGAALSGSELSVTPAHPWTIIAK